MVTSDVVLASACSSKTGLSGMLTPTVTWAPEHRVEQFKRDLAAGAVATGIDASHLCLAITARSGFLKLYETAYSHPLADIAGGQPGDPPR